MAKKLAIVFGIVFVLVGVLGMMDTSIVGSMGIFETNSLHNYVHLLVGIILLAVALMAPGMSALWLKIFGVVYFLLAVLGFLLIPSGGDLLGLVTMNTADHVLHAVLGIVLFLAGKSGSSSAPAMPMGGGMGQTM
jgi:hypothetical protein